MVFCLPKINARNHAHRQNESTPVRILTSTMKGPVETCSPPINPCNHLVGDGLRVKMSDNKNGLWIDGDGCRVSLATNSGLLRVTGDGCRVHITNNLGSVEYTGDGGHIILGPESINHENIKYQGDGGVIEFGNTRKCTNESRKKDEKGKVTVTTTRRNEEKFGNIVVTKVTTSTKDRSSERKAKTSDQKLEDKNCAKKPTTSAKSRVYVNVCVKSKVSM